MGSAVHCCSPPFLQADRHTAPVMPARWQYCHQPGHPTAFLPPPTGSQVLDLLCPKADAGRPEGQQAPCCWMHGTCGGKGPWQRLPGAAACAAGHIRRLHVLRALAGGYFEPGHRCHLCCHFSLTIQCQEGPGGCSHSSFPHRMA